MRYEGNTLREALGKALGTRDQYGRKIVRGQPLVQKQDVAPGEYTIEQQDLLYRTRIEAVQRAKNWLRANFTWRSNEEIGYVEYFNVLTGEFDRRPPNGDAGHPCGNLLQPKYCYTEGPRDAGWEVLVWGHSHPATDNSPTAPSFHSDARYGPDDPALLRFAPVVIISRKIRNDPYCEPVRRSYDRWSLAEPTPPSRR